MYEGKTDCLYYYKVLDTTKQSRTFKVIDAPGFGFAKRSHSEQNVWAKLMRIYFQKSRLLKRTFFLIDSSREISNLEFDVFLFDSCKQKLLEFMASLEREVNLVFTKVDKAHPELVLKNLIAMRDHIREKDTGFANSLFHLVGIG